MGGQETREAREVRGGVEWGGKERKGREAEAKGSAVQCSNEAKVWQRVRMGYIDR
jgi:hypothetical protein